MQKRYIALFIIAATLFAEILYASTTHFKKNYDYLVLPASATQKIPVNNNQVQVTEFFSYGCPACYKLEPYIVNWEKTKPSYVAFSRVPVIFQPAWTTYAKAYYVSRLQNKNIDEALFEAIQVDKTNLSTTNQMAAFLDKNGIQKNFFLQNENTPSIDLKLKQAQNLVNAAMIYQIPTVVIDGKYRIDPSLTGDDPNRFIAVMNYLIQKEASEKKLR